MDHSELLAAYIAGIDSIGNSVRGMTAAELQARPIAGKWTTLEVVCHLADSEALFADRMKRVLIQERPLLPFVDPARSITSLVYRERDVDEELNCIASIRRQMARILQHQSSAAWLRIGIHSRQGEQSMEQLLLKAVNHLEHHVAFIREKRSVLEQSKTSVSEGQTE